MTTWISVILSREELEALSALAICEFRDTRKQAALIIRQELERRGLLPAVDRLAQLTAEQAGREASDAN